MWMRLLSGIEGGHAAPILTHVLQGSPAKCVTHLPGLPGVGSCQFAGWQLVPPKGGQ